MSSVWLKAVAGPSSRLHVGPVVSLTSNFLIPLLLVALLIHLSLLVCIVARWRSIVSIWMVCLAIYIKICRRLGTRLD